MMFASLKMSSYKKYLIQQGSLIFSSEALDLFFFSPSKTTLAFFNWKERSVIQGLELLLKAEKEALYFPCSIPEGSLCLQGL